MRFPCDGPLMESTGLEVCRLDPDDIDFDCDRCRAEWDANEELLADMQREEVRDTWG